MNLILGMMVSNYDQVVVIISWRTQSGQLSAKLGLCMFNTVQVGNNLKKKCTESVRRFWSCLTLQQTHLTFSSCQTLSIKKLTCFIKCSQHWPCPCNIYLMILVLSLSCQNTFHDENKIQKTMPQLSFLNNNF